MIDYTVDLLIFGISIKENRNIRELAKRSLSIILVKRFNEPFKEMLVLPGGYVNSDETSETAAKRILEKETGLKNIELYLSSVNDEIDRDPRNRTISVSYIALVDVEKIDRKLKENSEWFDVDYYINDDTIDIKLSNKCNDVFFSLGRKIIDKKSEYEKYYLLNEKKLGFDHEIILAKGINDLRNRIQHTDIIFNLLPKYFTIGSLEQIYGNILKEKIVNSAFRRTFAEKLQITDEIIKTGGHRPSYLYKYNEKIIKPIKIYKDEMVDIYNPETMEKTGEIISKTSVHNLGIWHGSVHLIIINKDKTKTLFQQRSSKKELYPNMWDISVGGHISSGESEQIAVRRELNEELGINPNKYKIEFIKKYKEELSYKGIDSKEIVSLFILFLDNNIEKLKLQKEEVSDVKWLTKKEIESLVKEKKVIPHIEEYNLLKEILK